MIIVHLMRCVLLLLTQWIDLGHSVWAYSIAACGKCALIRIGDPPVLYVYICICVGVHKTLA